VDPTKVGIKKAVDPTKVGIKKAVDPTKVGIKKVKSCESNSFSMYIT